MHPDHSHEHALFCAWLAGFVDGEGTLTIIAEWHKDVRRYRPMLSITNTDRAALALIQAWVGDGRLSATAGDERVRTYYDYRIRGTKAQALVRLIRPYLRAKTTQADALLAFEPIPKPLHSGTGRGAAERRRLREEIVVRQAAACAAAQALNRTRTEPPPAPEPVDRDVFLAWAAGFVDAEGCLTINKQPDRGLLYYSPDISIANVVRAPLDAVHFLARCGHIGLNRRPNPRHRPVFRYSARGLKVQPFLAAIRPYLRVKAAQADVLLGFRPMPSYRGGRYPAPSVRTEIALLRAPQEEAYALIRRLNRRGPEQPPV